MKKQAWLILCIIALVAGLALAATNMVTAGPIEEQRVKATQAARIAVFPDASTFEAMPEDTYGSLDSVYKAMSGSDLLGYVLQITVSGYGGPIEIIMGVDTKGVITGLTVGGSNFAETAGLGTQVKEPAFTDQFVGLNEMPTLNGNVDTISGATISSSAVINGVIRCYQQWETLSSGSDASASVSPSDPASTPASALPAAAAAPEPTATPEVHEDGVFIGEGDGFIGPIKVSVAVENGAITGIKVLDASDSDALFAMSRDGVIPAVIKANGTAGVDTVTGATYSSQGLIDAIDDALCATCAETASALALQAPYTNGTLLGEAQGFSGKIRVSVTVVEGVITDVKVLDQNDTDAIFAMARNAILPAIIAADGTAGVDTVSGATYSSQGIIDAVNSALDSSVLSAAYDTDTVQTIPGDGVYTGEAQGFMGRIKVAVTVSSGQITAIRIVSQGDTESIFAMARDAIVPAVIAANGTDGVDTVSGATYSSQGLIDAISEALCATCSESLIMGTVPVYADGVFVGEAQGYMGPVKVAVTVISGAITDIKVVSNNDTDALFAAAKDAVIPAVIAAETVTGVDTVAGATYSSQGLLDAIADALSKPSPAAYQYTDGMFEGGAQGYSGVIRVSVTVQDGAIASIDVLESGDDPTMFSMVKDAIVPAVVAGNTTNGIDAVSAATSSSQGLINAINDALSQAVPE